MAGTKRLNKELIFQTILPGAGMCVIVAGVAGGFGYLAWSTYPRNNREDPIPTLQNHTAIPGDAGTYRLSGSGQVVTKQGDYKYTFNYEALQVIIEGEDALEPIPFPAFSNPAMIDDIRAKGCILGASFVTASDSYLAAKPREERIQEYVAESRAVAQAFLTGYCPAQRNIPHVR